MYVEVMVIVARYSSGARLRIRSWLKKFSALRRQMALRVTGVPSPWFRAPGGRKDRCTDMSEYAGTGVGWWPRWQKHQFRHRGKKHE